MSDWLVAECVLPWLVARPPLSTYGTDNNRWPTWPRVQQIRSVVSFGGVCRRLHGVVCGARTVWAVVDIGRAIKEIVGGDKDKAIAAALDVLGCVPRPVLTVCGAFSFFSWPGLPLPLLLTFVLVMPALTQLHLVVSEEYSDVPSADLIELIPAADVTEWRGRGWWPAEAIGMVTVDHLLRAISSLTSLTDLNIEVYYKVFALTTFPRSLHRLTVSLCGDVSKLFGVGPHNQIR
jgi:hypothetical protein